MSKFLSVKYGPEKLSDARFGVRQRMIFSKSMTIDQDELNGIGLAGEDRAERTRTEARLIEKLKEGDEMAFHRLVELFGSHVYSLLLSKTGDPEEAKDLTQETFLRAARGIGNFRGDSGIRTWLFRIAINQSRNRFRWWKRRKKDETVSIDRKLGDSELSFSDRIRDEKLNPEEKTLVNEETDRLISAVRELPENYRNAVLLCDVDGLSYDEISEVLGIGLGTVKSRIARGRRELRKKLKDV